MISLIQLLFVTDIKNNDFILYTGWIMISIVCVNVIINFIISFIYNIKAKCIKQSKRKIKVFQNTRIITNTSVTSRVDTPNINSSKTLIRNTPELHRPYREKVIDNTKIRKLVRFKFLCLLTLQFVSVLYIQENRKKI